MKTSWERPLDSEQPLQKLTFYFVSTQQDLWRYQLQI